MQKSSTKYKQAKFNSTLKGSYTPTNKKTKIKKKKEMDETGAHYTESSKPER